MKISKFPLFSLIVFGATVIYALVFCNFYVAKILFDGRSKDFIQETMTTFLNDFDQAKRYKVSEMISDEVLMQVQDRFRVRYGKCKLKDISMLKRFQMNSSMVLKEYTVTLDCEKKRDVPIVVTLRQTDNEVRYIGLRGDF